MPQIFEQQQQYLVHEVEGIPVIEIPLVQGSIAQLPDWFGHTLRSTILSDFYLNDFDVSEKLVFEKVKHKYLTIIHHIKKSMRDKDKKYIVIQTTRQPYRVISVENVDSNVLAHPLSANGTFYYAEIVLSIGGFHL